MLNVLIVRFGLRDVMMKKYQKAIGSILIIFVILASIAIINNFQTSTTISFMAVDRVEIINIRFIAGNDTFPDQLRIALQNWDSHSLTISNGSLNGIFATIISPKSAVIQGGYSAFVTLTFKPHTFVDGSQYDAELNTNMSTPIGSHLTFDAVYSAQQDYDISLPPPFHESLRTAQLIVVSSIIATLGVTFGLFTYTMFDRGRKRSLSIRELATLIGINSNISLLIPVIGKNLYDYNYSWVPQLSPITGIVSLVFLSYGVFHLFGLDIEGEKRRAKIFAILLLTATLLAIFMFVRLMNMFVTY